MAKDPGPINMSVAGWQWPKVGFRKAWLRHRLPEMMWKFTFASLVDRYKDGFRSQSDITWAVYLSWNMACPVFIYRLEVEPAEGVERGEDTPTT